MAVGAGILVNRHHGLRIADRIIVMADNTISRLQEDGVRITVTTMLSHIIVAMTGDTGSNRGAGTLAAGNGIVNGRLQRQAFRVRHGNGIIVMTEVTAVAQTVV